MSVGRKPGGYDVGEAGSDAVSCVLDWAHEKYLGAKNNGHDHSFPADVGEKQQLSLIIDKGAWSSGVRTLNASF